MNRTKMVFPLILALILMPMSVLAQEKAGSDSHAQPAANVEMKQDAPSHSGPGKHGAQHHPMGMSEEMKAAHDKFVNKLKEMDVRLSEKVAAMDAAGADQKLAAMEGVIRELVVQRQEMRELYRDAHHAGMCMMMIKSGDMEHKGMMHKCPMMQGHQGMPGGAAEGKPDVHKGHGGQ